MSTKPKISKEKSEKKRRYTLDHRLPDVIRLISVLSLHEHAFRSEEGINRSLRRLPESVPSKKWQDVINDHPEFFRSNGNGDYFALVIRSYFSENAKPEDEKILLRPPLPVIETQNLINVAINLYDKEVERNKKTGLWFPIVVACIVLAGQIFNTIYSNKSTSGTNKNLVAIKDSIQYTNKKLDKVLISLPHK